MEYSIHTNNREQVQKKKTEEGGKKKMNSILSQSYLTTSDVTLEPGLGILTSRSQAQIEPFIYSSPMDTVTGIEMTRKMVELDEYPVVCRFIPEWDEAIREFGDNPNVFFAIGTKGEKLNTIKELHKAGIISGPISISVDIAHGDSLIGHQVTQEVSKLDFVQNVMSGTVCTEAGALRAINSGCTHIRVGVGPGSACTTRLMTGCGLPNLSAVYKIYKAITSRWGTYHNIRIVADGGIKYPGDAVKYLAAGADGIMGGSIFSRCPESPGWMQDSSGLYKHYRGQASRQFQKDLLGRTPDCAEGAVGPRIRPDETCEEVVNKFKGGLRSAISYLGINSIDQLIPENVYFVKVTPAGFQEGTPHGA
jgi:IMP dehydrogenase